MNVFDLLNTCSGVWYSNTKAICVRAVEACEHMCSMCTFHQYGFIFGRRLFFLQIVDLCVIDIENIVFQFIFPFSFIT
jgi:hypothetical protein